MRTQCIWRWPRLVTLSLERSAQEKRENDGKKPPPPLLLLLQPLLQPLLPLLQQLPSCLSRPQRSVELLPAASPQRRRGNSLPTATTASVAIAVVAATTVHATTGWRWRHCNARVLLLLLDARYLQLASEGSASF